MIRWRKNGRPQPGVSPRGSYQYPDPPLPLDVETYINRRAHIEADKLHWERLWIKAKRGSQDQMLHFERMCAALSAMGILDHGRDGQWIDPRVEAEYRADVAAITERLRQAVQPEGETIVVHCGPMVGRPVTQRDTPRMRQIAVQQLGLNDESELPE